MRSDPMPWRSWHLISVRRPSPSVCEHGRPDHQDLLRQLSIAALGVEPPALNATPEQVWNGLLDEIESLRRKAALHA